MNAVSTCALAMPNALPGTSVVSNTPAEGRVFGISEMLLGGFEDLLAEVAGEMLADADASDVEPETPDALTDLENGDRDARHVFLAAMQPPVEPVSWKRRQTDAVRVESGVVAQAPTGDVHPEDLLLDAVTDTEMTDVSMDPLATLAVETEPQAVPTPPRSDARVHIPDDAKDLAPETANGTGEAMAESAVHATVSSEAPETDAPERLDGMAPAPAPNQPAETVSLEELLVEALNEPQPTPELPVHETNTDTVRVEIDDDLAVEVSAVDGDVDVTLLGADAVRPVMRTMEGELRDALRRGGYELGAFERDAQDAPRKRNPRREQRDNPSRQPRDGVLL